ncbi:MAG: hypothetical protein J6J18_08775 [Oscillospiraceae bacterium]|nr:hypothetical protein [Oscillospiraceae bacterium]
MEIWDAYLPNGTLAGCNLVRGEPIPEGLRHFVSEILVRHADGEYLLMQRDPRKCNYGGYFESTAGGSALKGEDAYCCAKLGARSAFVISNQEFYKKLGFQPDCSFRFFWKN